MSRIRSGRRRWAIGPALAICILGGATGTANAFEVSGDTGIRGDFSLADTQASPAGVCGYAFDHSDGAQDFYSFSSMKVRAPSVYAADRNADRRDSRMVSWRFHLYQMPAAGAPGWTTVAGSPVQKARAYEDAPAAFAPLSVNFNGSNDYLYRAHVVIKWFKSNGTVEGKVRLFLDWYREKGGDFAFENDCYGGFVRA